MATTTTLKNSLFSLFGVDTARMDAARMSQLERVRSAMLDCFPLEGRTDAMEYLSHRLRHAPDVQTLWYLRSDLMEMLSRSLGESAARTRVNGISQMFKGMLPKSLEPRSNRFKL